jgi:hypothetical protein
MRSCTLDDLAFLYRKQRRKEPEKEPSSKALFFAANMGRWDELGMAGVVLTTRSDVLACLLGVPNRSVFQVTAEAVGSSLDRKEAIKVMAQGLLDRVGAIGCRSLVHYVPLEEWEEAKAYKDAGFQLLKKLELCNEAGVDKDIYVFTFGATIVGGEDDGDEEAYLRGGPDFEGGPSSQPIPGGPSQSNTN